MNFLYLLTARVTVSGGEITSVTFTRSQDESEYPEDNDPYISYAANGRTRGGVYYAGMAAQIVAAQSADGLDAVTGATYSSRAMQAAARQALAGAAR